MFKTKDKRIKLLKHYPPKIELTFSPSRNHIHKECGVP